MKRWNSLFLLLALIPAVLNARLPDHRNRAVNDLAGIISYSYQNKMESMAREVLQKTGSSVVVATVNSLDDMEIEEYAVRLYEKWGIGGREEDKGVLILIAPNEHKVRIEVGYGLEHVLTDGLCGQIINSYMKPAFEAGDYTAGIYTGFLAVTDAIAKDAGVQITGAPAARQRVYDGHRRSKSCGGTLFFIFIIFLVIVTRGRILPWLFLGAMMGGGGNRGGFGGGGFGGGFGGFGGGMSGGGGASGSW